MPGGLIELSPPGILFAPPATGHTSHKAVHLTRPRAARSHTPHKAARLGTPTR